jgi:hypothetical protein
MLALARYHMIESRGIVPAILQIIGQSIAKLQSREKARRAQNRESKAWVRETTDCCLLTNLPRR